MLLPDAVARAFYQNKQLATVILHILPALAACGSRPDLQ